MINATFWKRLTARFAAMAGTGAPTDRQTAAVSPDKYGIYGLGIQPYQNPDELVWSKGQGVAIYQDMAREPHVVSALEQIKFRILAGDWQVSPGGDDDKYKEPAELVEWVLKSGIRSGTFKADLFELLDAFDVGFSVSEIVWSLIDRGPHKGKVGIETLKAKNPYWIDFDIDAFGTIKPDGLVIRQAANGQANVRLDVSKFVIFHHLARYENPYGTPRLRRAYRAYWIKDTAWKLRAIFLERFSGNHPILKYPDGNVQAKEELEAILKAWNSETGLVIPESAMAESLKIASGSQSEFSKAIEDLNREILVGILGQSLTAEAPTHGTQALGNVQAEVVDNAVEFFQGSLEAVINQQLVRRLVDYNFADVDVYPCWGFKQKETDLPQQIEIDKGLVDIGVPLAKSYFYERYGRPKPDDDVDPDELVKKPDPPPSPFDQGADPGQIEPLDQMAEALWTMAERADDDLDELTALATGQLKAAYRKVFDSILTQADKKLDQGQPKFAVNVGPIKGVLEKADLAASMWGRLQIIREVEAQGETWPGRGEDGEFQSFADADVAPSLMDPEELRAALAGLVPMERAAYDALIEESRRRALTVAGLSKAQIEQDVQSALVAMVNQGESIEWFKREVRRRGLKYVGPAYGKDLAGQAVRPYHAELVARNAVMQSANRGRFEMIRSAPELVPGVQYSAIEDRRTSALCRMLNGNIYRADDPIVEAYNPPNHHNCRSMWIPITVRNWDAGKVSEPPPRDLKPDPGFGG